MFELREYQFAKQLVLTVKRIQLEHQIVWQTSPLWNWWNQIDRSSMSALQNIAEAIGRGRGYARTAYLTARGEVFETYASADVAPEEIRVPLQRIAIETVQAIDASLLETCNEQLKQIESNTKSDKKCALSEEHVVNQRVESDDQVSSDGTK